MTPMNINASTYQIDATTSSAAATLIEQDVNSTRVIVYNGASTNAFIVSGASSPTAVFPTSATAPLTGVVVAAGSTQTYFKDPKHKYIAVILESGTGSVFLSIGQGE